MERLRPSGSSSKVAYTSFGATCGCLWLIGMKLRGWDSICFEQRSMKKHCHVCRHMLGTQHLEENQSCSEHIRAALWALLPLLGQKAKLALFVLPRASIPRLRLDPSPDAATSSCWEKEKSQHTGVLRCCTRCVTCVTLRVPSSPCPVSSCRFAGLPCAFLLMCACRLAQAWQTK